MLDFNYFDRVECLGSDVFTCVIEEDTSDEMIDFINELIDIFGEPDGLKWTIHVEKWFNSRGIVTPSTKLVTINSTDLEVSMYLRLRI